MPAREADVTFGPAWSGTESATYPGRFPLSVERHVLNTVDRLVPGVTTVTLNARFYAVHALIAADASARHLDLVAAPNPMRRAEVAGGAGSARGAYRGARGPPGVSPPP